MDSLQEKVIPTPKPNYLPWILGGIGAVIVGLVWHFTKKRVSYSLEKENK